MLLALAWRGIIVHQQHRCAFLRRFRAIHERQHAAAPRVGRRRQPIAIIADRMFLVFQWLTAAPNVARENHQALELTLVQQPVARVRPALELQHHPARRCRRCARRKQRLLAAALCIEQAGKGARRHIWQQHAARAYYRLDIRCLRESKLRLWHLLEHLNQFGAPGLVGRRFACALGQHGDVQQRSDLRVDRQQHLALRASSSIVWQAVSCVAQQPGLAPAGAGAPEQRCAKGARLRQIQAADLRAAAPVAKDPIWR